ncbi:heavy-metal-associated domain-containing protein [Emticicia sp. 17c]|uniref:heavy-metal-associated domain-containing protein n=1 Tax=Emticicia sp. 17c TaxID=3127704 RepID=UPI00301D92CC
MNIVVDKLFVDNLKCSGCAHTIKQSLMNIVGVLEVRPNPEEGWVEVEHEDFTDTDNITRRLAELGYPKAGTSNLLQTARSYVSCALGKINT